MSLLEATVLGLVQGLTEFLPISSSAHLRIVPALLGWKDPGAAYSAVIQLGTAGRTLPELAGWELCWHFQPAGNARRVLRSARDAIASALAFERQTQGFYIDVAENSRDDALRAFAAEMAGDEQRHIARLEVLLEREPDPAAGMEAGDAQVKSI